MLLPPIVILFIVSFFALVVLFGLYRKSGLMLLIGGVMFFVGMLPFEGLDLESSQIESVALNEECEGGAEIVATHYSQTTGSTATAIYGASFNYRGIHVGTGSELIGDIVNNATFSLSKTGGPTGTVRFAVYDATAGTPIQKFLFGTKNIATDISTTEGYIEVVNATHEYTLVAGDRIAVQYAGGDGSNRLNHISLNSNNFDGTATQANFLDPPGAWTNGGSDWDSKAIIRGFVNSEVCLTSESYTYVDNDFYFDAIWRIILPLSGLLVAFVGVGKYGLSI